MGRHDPRRRGPSYARGELKKALTLAAIDPDARPSIPFDYWVDGIERKYGQRPGSARDWPVEDFLRAAEYHRIEGSISVKRSK